MVPSVPRPAPATTAILVDGDNVPPSVLADLLDHVSGPSERRVFRNWRSTRDAKAWDDASKRLAFERVDRYRTTSGKNGSDIAVAVAAMDFLHDGVARFVIVSGDTDFTPLVERLRRGGAHVTVAGHKAVGGLLADVADVYIPWSALGTAKKAAPAPRKRAAAPAPRPAKAAAPRKRAAPPARSAAPPAARPAPPAARPLPPARQAAPPPANRLVEVLKDAYNVAMTDGEVDAEGWVAVDRLGMVARTVEADFSPGKYGLPKRASLSKVLQGLPGFEVDSRGRRGNSVQYRVRLRR
ncbi:MAG: hypothetical protein QOD77_592 [Thermoplasmata archaeon]|jgi:hypothetical protein|nr:hypothetical protein [Thermoplasmata archaeon]